MELFEHCQKSGQWEFNNETVKKIGQKLGFGNPFDATKIDSKYQLPEALRSRGYCVAHLGKGKHKFIQAINQWYHEFEDIEEDEKWRWRYRSSLLNDLESGEASALSLAYNQRLLHDFLYEDITATPRIYLPGRTRINMEYFVAGVKLSTEDQQLEIDLTLEYQGRITVIEAKNRFLRDFAVYQIFHPVKYYIVKTKDLDRSDVRLDACYILRQKQRVRIYLYEFEDSDRVDSIRLVRKAEYELVRR